MGEGKSEVMEEMIRVFHLTMKHTVDEIEGLPHALVNERIDQEIEQLLAEEFEEEEDV